MMIAIQGSHNVKFFMSIIIFLKDCKRYDDNWLIAKDSDDDDDDDGIIERKPEYLDGTYNTINIM